MKDWLENIRWFYHKAAEIEGLVLMKTARLDYTKLNIDMSRFGFDGAELEKFLMSHGVFPELVSGNMVMCMSGIGNTRRDYERLIEALSEAAERGRPDRIDRLDRSALVETTRADRMERACRDSWAGSIETARQLTAEPRTESPFAVGAGADRDSAGERKRSYNTGRRQSLRCLPSYRTRRGFLSYVREKFLRRKLSITSKRREKQAKK